MGPLIPLAISAATSLANAFMQKKTAESNTDKTIRANKQMAQFQYSKDLEMWNRQNEYNTPEAQMLRYKEAGLNPNLIYGQGSSGNATVMPKYNAPTLQYNYKAMEIPEMIGRYQDVAMKQAQIDNQRALVQQTKTKNDILATEKQWRNMLLHNKNLLLGSQADKAYMEKEWMYSDENSSYGQKGMNRLDYQLEGLKEENRKKTEMINNLIQSTANKAIDFKIKKLDLDWMEKMKMSKIGSEIVPLLRLFFYNK